MPLSEILGFSVLSANDVVTFSLALLTVWLTYKVLEPLWSPLRKLPGMSYNPLLGNMRFLMAGQAMEATLKMVRQFGSICRFYFMFGRERLLIADPLLMKHVFVTNARNYIKPPERISLIKVVLGNGLVTSEGMTHTVHKRLLSPAFNKQSIAKMIPVFEAQVKKLADLWSKNAPADGSVLLPVHLDLQRTTLDIIGRTAFGYDFNSLDNPDHEVCVAFHNILSGLIFSWRLILPFYIYLPIPEVRKIRSNIGTMNDVVMHIIDEKRKSIRRGEDLDRVAGDVLGKMILAHDEETDQRLTDQDLRDETITLMLAGHETTAVAMAWCLLMLATHQDIQEKARREIASICGCEGGELSIDVLDRMEYCGCVVKETLRLFPPVPMTLRQAESDDILPGGHFIPAGTIINMSLGPMMRTNDLYADAESFIPERFMEKETDSSFYKFSPFIYGPRQCLGYRFALVEMKVMLAVLLGRLRFDLDPNGPEYKRRMTITMRPHPSLKLLVSINKD